jgi:hypothetical protein
MKRVHGKPDRASSVPPVPRGAARTEALAEIASEARSRILSTPSPLDSLTAEEWARFRANDQPEIIGAGPARAGKTND